MDYKEKLNLLIKAEKTLNPKATVAGRLGISETYIGMILNGVCEPGPKTLRMIEDMEAAPSTGSPAVR